MQLGLWFCHRDMTYIYFLLALGFGSPPAHPSVLDLHSAQKPAKKRKGTPGNEEEKLKQLELSGLVDINEEEAV